MKINIVHYRSGDYEALIDIWDRSGLLYKPKGRDSRSSIEAEVQKDCNQFLFAEYGGNYVGALLVTHDGRKGWINRVAVVPEFRKKGVARQLINFAEDWLDREGIGIYACQIEGYNRESLEVFQKMGYIPFEGMHYLTKRKFPEI
ncbi:MAG: GNAT family N-acetyltransferase [bacterium]